MGLCVLVTGAGRGIGRALVERLVSDVRVQTLVAVTASDSSVAALIQTVAPMAREGIHFVVEQCNFNDLSAVERLGEQWGSHIDWLVNNAGISLVKPMAKTTTEEWERVMRVNTTAPFILSRSMLAGRMPSDASTTANRPSRRVGAIVNVSSQAAKSALSDHSVYCTSKAALEGLTRMTALEGGEVGVRCNAIAPTIVMTSMGQTVWGGDENAGKREPVLARIPGGRLATENDCVEALMFLLDEDKSGMINAHVLMVDGGFTQL